ncbi:MAG: glycosyltransferase [Gemmatimonadota bacterium]|nr:glycosyltransferase [Gemmatimonadota bacterium]
MHSTNDLRIVRYYPRALVGDGGITRSVWHHSLELSSADVAVRIAYDEGSAPATPGSVELVPIRHAGWPWKVPIGLDECLADADLMVLHSAWVLHNVRAGAVARKVDVPYLLEPRGAYDPRIRARKRPLKRLWWRVWERNLVMGARAIHVFFDSQREYVRSLGYDGDIVVAPNGVEIRDEFRWDGGNDGYLLWYGRFDPEHKGIDMLIEALALLDPGERPPLRLHGPDARIGGKDEIRRRVASLGLERWVSIGDPVYGEVKYGMLARARGFVYPSRWEAFGNAPAEAASVGVPTVVTPYPLGRHLAGRDAAILVEPDSGSLADGIRATGRKEAAEIGSRAAEVIREEFRWSAVTGRWLEQVEGLL